MADERKITYYVDHFMSKPSNTIRLYNKLDSGGYDLIAVAPYKPGSLSFSINNNWTGMGTSGAGLIYSAVAKAKNSIATFGTDITSLINAITSSFGGDATGLTTSNPNETMKTLLQGANSNYTSLADEYKKFGGSTFTPVIPPLTCIYHQGFNYNGLHHDPIDWIKKLLVVSKGEVVDSDSSNWYRQVKAPNGFKLEMNVANDTSNMPGTLSLVIGGNDTDTNISANENPNSSLGTGIVINNLLVTSLNVTYSDEFVSDKHPLYAIAEVNLELARIQFATDTNLSNYFLQGEA